MDADADRISTVTPIAHPITQLWGHNYWNTFSIIQGSIGEHNTRNPLCFVKDFVSIIMTDNLSIEKCWPKSTQLVSQWGNYSYKCYRFNLFGVKWICRSERLHKFWNSAPDEKSTAQFQSEIHYTAPNQNR